MKRMRCCSLLPLRALRRLWADESGAEVLEYVFVALLLIVITITTVAAFGTKVLARWSSVNSSM